MQPLQQKPINSKFLKVLCPRCSSNQIIFGKSSSYIKCKKCSKLLTKTTGGKVKIRAKISKILWN